MIPLIDLWLPILLATVIVFFASSIIWMATPIHKNDYLSPGQQEGPIMDLVRGSGLRPGVYFVPWCDKNARDPEVRARFMAGPWAMLTVLGSAPKMGRNLSMWILHLFIVALIVAYVVSNAGLARGTSYWLVFRMAATVSLLAHAGYALPMSIWHGQPWRQIPGRLFDGVVYALLTGGCFAGFWPESVQPG